MRIAPQDSSCGSKDERRKKLQRHHGTVKDHEQEVSALRGLTNKSAEPGSTKSDSIVYSSRKTT